MNHDSEILIYQTVDNQIEIQVKFESETVWLTLNQIAELFSRDKSVISRHLNNIYKEGELDKSATVAKNATVQVEANRSVSREIDYYNLDAILSVGYRVNSKQGTKFRQWASQRLKDYLQQGYSLNKYRLEQLGKVISVIENSAKTEGLALDEVKGLLSILSQYANSFILLNRFDSANLNTDRLNENITYKIDYQEAKNAIAMLKKQLIDKNEASDLFGHEKGDSFKSSLVSIVQSFGGNYLYPSIEEQAANLLYFVIKNHSFSDGNKRIGAFLFVWFLERNKHQFKRNGELKINDNALVTLAILVAKSLPNEKELLIQLVINLIIES